MTIYKKKINVEARKLGEVFLLGDFINVNDTSI